MAADPAPIPRAPMGPRNMNPTRPPTSPLRTVAFLRCFLSRDNSSSPVIVCVGPPLPPNQLHLLWLAGMLCWLFKRSCVAGVSTQWTKGCCLFCVDCNCSRTLILARSFSGVTKLCTEGVLKLSSVVFETPASSKGTNSTCTSAAVTAVAVLPVCEAWLTMTTDWATGRYGCSSVDCKPVAWSIEPTHSAMGGIIAVVFSFASTKRP